jgi:hypothetical protein
MMKKLIVATTLLLSLVLVASAFAAEQTGNLKGMTNQQQTTKSCCRMSAEKLQKMQACMDMMPAGKGMDNCQCTCCMRTHECRMMDGGNCCCGVMSKNKGVAGGDDKMMKDNKIKR